MVKPKKHLGQHFLKDKNIAHKIVKQLSAKPGYDYLIEIGPGTGVLSEFLLKDPVLPTYLVEIDQESFVYLREHYPDAQNHILLQDVLQWDLQAFLQNKTCGIIGNFPYNISSQIFFKVLEHRQQVLEVVGMLQKEVAERISSPPGNKAYGILSVLLQAFYDISYCFTVEPGVFHPPPKVKSGVIRLSRNDTESLPCNEKLFFRVVKQGFNNRRKTLRNALKPLGIPESIKGHTLFDKRAEQLSVRDFVTLTQMFENPKAA